MRLRPISVGSQVKGMLDSGFGSMWFPVLKVKETHIYISLLSSTFTDARLVSRERKVNQSAEKLIKVSNSNNNFTTSEMSELRDYLTNTNDLHNKLPSAGFIEE